MNSKNELDQAFAEFEAECSQGREIRREMINQLRKQVSVCEISSYDKPMMITAKLELLKTLDSIIKSDDDMSLKRLKTKLARKDSETNGVVGTAVINLLKMIRADRKDDEKNSGHAEEIKSAQEELLKRGEELAASTDPDIAKQVTVSQGELEECGTVPTSDAPAGTLEKLKKIDEEEDE